MSIVSSKLINLCYIKPEGVDILPMKRFILLGEDCEEDRDLVIWSYHLQDTN